MSVFRRPLNIRRHGSTSRARERGSFEQGVVKALDNGPGRREPRSLPWSVGPLFHDVDPIMLHRQPFVVHFMPFQACRRKRVVIDDRYRLRWLFVFADLLTGADAVAAPGEMGSGTSAIWAIA